MYPLIAVKTSIKLFVDEKICVVQFSNELGRMILTVPTEQLGVRRLNGNVFQKTIADILESRMYFKWKFKTYRCNPV